MKFDWQARHKHKINASQGIENFFILLTQFCVARGSRLLFRFFFPDEIRLILLVQAQIPHFHMLYSSSSSHTLFKSSSHLCQGSYSRPSRNLAFGTASRHFWSFWGRASFISSSTLINKTLLSNYGLLPLCKKALAWKYSLVLNKLPPNRLLIFGNSPSPTLFGPPFINFHKFQYQHL